MEEKKKDSGFVVKDKRLFGDSDEPRPRDKEEEAATPKKESSPDKSKETIHHAQADYPPVNFANFVLSLSTSALYHFGDFPDPEGGKSEKNLPAVKQTIDILDMLREKTKGNLDENENQLIEGVLYELKMRFVKEKG
ncbi:MAG TPA: DUF1844 domain-containing protein [Smithellaceae bacterium]|nr:DUF1844 domain-containing protein [Smithellaceae bacterium]HRS88971.1 DUF1844 domain-containing protein [Smithellaceae bacterium]HRV25587.1 DUF1844 domain-containing protein [Smithellaceae bacterium]